MIPINQITSFPNHPFKVRDDEKMMETVESVKKRGIIFPAIVRKKKDGTYEMVAGHRRRRACQLAQLSEMPCIVRELTDDEATILMVDSNVQREEILPSERAWAFKMKLEALNRQGKRVDLTSTPSVQKLSVEIVAEEFGISREQVRRYVALTNLDSALLKMVDENKIALRPAVQISYMKKQDQKELLDAIESFDATPSEKQAKLLRDLSEKGILDRDKIDEIMAEEKPNQVVQYKIKYERFRKYLPKNVETEQEVEDFLLICIKEHYNRVKQREMVIALFKISLFSPLLI